MSKDTEAKSPVLLILLVFFWVKFREKRDLKFTRNSFNFIYFLFMKQN